MFHSNTEQLIDYWRSRRIGPGAPSRTAIDPGDFIPLLPQVFILGRRGFGEFHFRLVGALLADLHGRALREESLIGLWEPEDRAPLQLALETVRRRVEPLVIEADACPAVGEPLRVELTLAPLTGAAGQADRMLGLYQPKGRAAILGGQPVESLSIRNIIMAGAAGEALPPLRLAAVNGRRIA